LIRRNFISNCAAGSIGMGLSGCSALRPKTVDIKMEMSPLDFETKVAKPAGTMPIGEIGKTGIRVSKFGFGAHMRSDMLQYKKEREWMVREAYDLGINFFDVYDKYSAGSYMHQYEPMGRYLAPVIKDVVISVIMWPYDGRNLEQEMERMLRLFGRDYIDLVRTQAWKNSRDDKVLSKQNRHRWEWWETLFKFKEKGYIRAVGLPIHTREDLEEPLEELPLDFVILPYNFYHNWLWGNKVPDEKIHTIIPKLRKKGIGVISMKPFAGDWLTEPFKRMAAQYDESGEINFAKACLRYVINSDINVDTTLGGMFNPFHVYENADAYFNPKMSDEESKVLKKIRKTAKAVTKNLLPEHYQFLEDWVPDSWDDSDLIGVV